MTIVAAVIARLAALSPVTTLVGSNIVATHLEQDSSSPGVLVQLVSKVEPIHLRGPDNIKRARVQVDSCAATKLLADSIAAAVHGNGLGTAATGLSGWKGRIGSPTVIFDCVKPDGERELYEAEERRQYRVQKDYLIDFQG